jgi:hypothetical protein
MFIEILHFILLHIAKILFTLVVVLCLFLFQLYSNEQKNQCSIRINIVIDIILRSLYIILGFIITVVICSCSYVFFIVTAIMPQTQFQPLISIILHRFFILICLIFFFSFSSYFFQKMASILTTEHRFLDCPGNKATYKIILETINQQIVSVLNLINSLFNEIYIRISKLQKSHNKN